MSEQAKFAAPLLNPDLAPPSGLKTWNGSDAQQRFAVYRNNVIVSWVDALADTFPVTEALVGTLFFRAMAKVFAYAHPPVSPIMANYGAAFPAFIETFSPAASLPYLPDVARLEWLRVIAFHAADAAPITAQRLQEVLADPAAMPTLCASLHPSLQILRSKFAVLSLWAAHQNDKGEPTMPIEIERAETALVLRSGLDVEVMQVSAAVGDFILRLQSRMSLAEAVSQVNEEGKTAFDLTAVLSLLIQKGALLALNLKE